MTEYQTKELSGTRPSSAQLKQGLPIFFDELSEVLRILQATGICTKLSAESLEMASHENTEPAMSEAAGRPYEVEIAKSGGRHGKELLLLGYTLSHVVHAYGSMCHSITELATKKTPKYPVRNFMI